MAGTRYSLICLTSHVEHMEPLTLKHFVFRYSQVTRTITVVPRLTQPSTLHGMVKCVIKFSRLFGVNVHQLTESDFSRDHVFKMSDITSPFTGCPLAHVPWLPVARVTVSYSS